MAAQTLRFLSWNIQKFGDKKAGDPHFINYVASVIVDVGADFVGIMEIVGWWGQDIRNKLVTALGSNWAGEESEMTPSRPNEQYLFLWRKDKISETGAVMLYGIINDGDLGTIYTKYNMSPDAQIAFLQALIKFDYIDEYFEILNDQRQNLLANPQSLDLGPGYTFGPNDKNFIAAVLTRMQNVPFPYSGARPPFLFFGEIIANNAQFTSVLFHAPQPANGWKYQAINNIGVIPDLQKSTNIVIMGDFNIQDNQFKNVAELFWIDSKGNFNQVFDSNGHKIFTTIFTTLTGPDPGGPYNGFPTIQFLKCKPLLNNTSLSSVRPGPFSDVDPCTAADLTAMLSSPYDQLFAYANGAANMQVFPAIGVMIPQPPLSTGIVNYSATVSWNAAQAYNQWAASHKGLSLKALPNGRNSAQIVYRQAISDHLFTLTDVTFA